MDMDLADDLQTLHELAQAVGLPNSGAVIHILAEIYRRDPVDAQIRLSVLQQHAARPVGGPGSYRAARGLIPWPEGDEPSEVTQRRMRGHTD